MGRNCQSVVIDFAIGDRREFNLFVLIDCGIWECVSYLGVKRLKFGLFLKFNLTLLEFVLLN